jgi:hypothetical protein
VYDPRWQVQPLISPARTRDGGQPAQILIGVVTVEGRPRLGIETIPPGPVGVDPASVDELMDHIRQMMSRIAEQPPEPES